MIQQGKNFFILALYSLILLLNACSSFNKDNAVLSNKTITIFPDYTNITIPANIAPLNFLIKDTADQYLVHFSGNDGSEFDVSSKSGNIQIPLKKWTKLLNANTGNSYSIEFYLKQGEFWNKHSAITNFISNDKIDNYLVYRWINPANILWDKMGIYQRNLQDFTVKPIMENALTDKNCMHCHSFAANNSNSFMLHMRGKPGGTVIYTEGKLKFVDTKTEYTLSAGGYPSWHPNGKLIAFSTNKIFQKFHASKDKYAFVYDKVSDIILYDVEKNEVQAIPKLSTTDLENMPTWSPDGKHLYFLSLPVEKTMSESYMDTKYDLKRISFNELTKTWGEIENLIIADSLGKSVAFPRVSANNRYVVCCLADYGYFTVYNETSDIALLDLETMQITKPDINSEFVESYPSWSSNGKWIMFNSKRADGLTSRPYFSYFDNGKAHKPFILPQENPMWNIEELNNINRPELATSEVPLNPQEIMKLVKNAAIPVSFDLESTSTPKLQIEDSIGDDHYLKFDQ